MAESIGRRSRAGAAESIEDGRADPGAGRSSWRASLENESSTKERRTAPEIEDEAAAAAGRGSRRPGRAAAMAARRGEELTYSSDTMLGIDKLYSLGAKGHNI
jgi:hypothetical protein